jgi:Fimbrial assembly protein (PilN)
MTQQINLFSPIFLKQKKVFSAVNMVDAMALLLVGVALFYGYASIETLNLDRQSVETARQYYQSKTRLSQASARYAPKKPDAALAAEVDTLQAQVNARKATLEDLGGGVFGSGTGYAEYMRALARQSLAGLWLTGFSIGKGGAEMEISGRALRPELVPSYIQRLTREKALQGRAFDSLSMTQRDGTLPADASRPGAAPAKYVYTEFRLVSSDDGLPAGGRPRQEQTRGGGSR